MFSPYQSKVFLTKIEKGFKQLLKKPKPLLAYNLEIFPKEEETFVYVQQKEKETLDYLTKGST
jgi:hypothetical protein